MTMSEYVITKEQLERALYRAFTLEDSRDILTRPLSSALKAEREKALIPIKAVYDRFSHLDKILSARDPDCPMRQCYSDIWIVIKESLRGEQP